MYVMCMVLVCVGYLECERPLLSAKDDLFVYGKDDLLVYAYGLGGSWRKLEEVGGS